VLLWIDGEQRSPLYHVSICSCTSETDIDWCRIVSSKGKPRPHTHFCFSSSLGRVKASSKAIFPFMSIDFSNP
jgi:hypothetical protein